MTITRVPTFLCAVLAMAQTASDSGQDRVFKFETISTVQQMQEAATVVRALSEIRQYSIDTAAKQMSVHGTPDQIGLAAWLFGELDRPGNQEPPSSQPEPVLEYRMASGPENVVRIFYVPYAQTVQTFQEVVTAVRSSAEIPRMFTYNAPRAAAARGTAGQIALADWLFQQFGTATNQSSAPAIYNVPGGKDDIVRVFHLSRPQTIQEFQEVATLIRAIGYIRYLFTYNAAGKFVVRGTSDQTELVRWLVTELDKSPHETGASSEYHMASGPENIVRVFYLPNRGTVAQFQQQATAIREKSRIRRLFTWNQPRALVLRGTATQIDQAAELIVQQTKSN